MISVDTDLPAGNGRVLGIDGDTIRLAPDYRDTPDGWFWWCVRVRGAVGRTLTLHFEDFSLGPLGPAYSVDGGQNWGWVGGDGDGKVASVRVTHDELWLANSIPYHSSRLTTWLGQWQQACGIAVHTLCMSGKGRSVPYFTAGNPQATQAVVLCARHHACESLASYVLEGLLQTLAADDAVGHWWRTLVALLVIPMVDFDGVMDGDQGKNRAPYDHNRDYDVDGGRYVEVRAIKELVPRWLAGRRFVGMDMHCPWLRGGRNETVFFVHGPDAEHARRVQDFSLIFERHGQTLRHREADDMPFGVDWNTGNEARNCRGFLVGLPGCAMATTLEVTYHRANGVAQSIEGSRACGRELAVSMAEYMRGLVP